MAKQRSRFDDYLASDIDNDDIVKVKRIYISICGGKGADGLFFSQLMYWMPRATIIHDGKLWVAKTYAEWESEIGINERTTRRIIDRLKELGLVETAVYKFKGNPTAHIRVIGEKFIELRDALTDKSESPEWTEPDGQNGQNDVTDSDSSYTENTTENTSVKKKSALFESHAKQITTHRNLIKEHAHLADREELSKGHTTTKTPHAYAVMCRFFDMIFAPAPKGKKDQTPAVKEYAAKVKDYLLKKHQTLKDLLDFIDWYCETFPEFEYFPGTARSKKPAENAATFKETYDKFIKHQVESSPTWCPECGGMQIVYRYPEGADVRFATKEPVDCPVCVVSED